MGGKKGGKKGAKHGGGGKGGHKQDERRERQARRREERLKQWHDPKWKQDFQRFEAQLRVLGLRIVDMTGDGNCMFRAVSDQMEGTAEHHRRVRRQAVESLRAHREQFAPFLDTDVQSFDEYCDDMATEGEWGSAVELQALSLALRVNIVVHQLDNPRWEMVNFPATQKTIHLSYHNGDHYSSVRPLEGALLPSVASAPGGVADRSAYGGSSHHDGEDSGDDSDDEAVAAAVAASRRSPVAPRAPVSAVSEEVQLVMAATDCSDVEMVKQTLVENLYDVQAAIDYIILLQQTGDDHSLAPPADVPCAPKSAKKGRPKSREAQAPVSAYDSRTDAERRATEWEDGHEVEEPRDELPVYGGKGNHTGKSKGARAKAAESAEDPNVQLARQIVELERKKNPSNKERKELNQLRKRAAQAKLDVEALASGRPGGSKAAKAPAAAVEEDEEVDELVAQVKDLGVRAL